MLDTCAHGFSAETKKHRVWVTFNGKTFRDLPKGPHGRASNYPVEPGCVRKMARLFEIEECAKSQLGIKLS